MLPSAVDPLELINFGNAPAGPNKPTAWDLIRFGYELYRIEHLPEDADLTGREQNDPGVIELVEVLPKVLARFEFDTTDKALRSSIERLLSNLRFYMDEEDVCCLDGRRERLTNAISSLIHSLRREEGQRPVLMMMADISFKDFLAKNIRDYYPFLPPELDLFLSRADESWQVGFYHSAVIFTLLATEQVFRYFYKRIRITDPPDGATWGNQLDDLRESHPEIQETLLSEIDDIINYYRNPVMHGAISNQRQDKWKDTPTDVIENVLGEMPFEHNEPCSIEPMNANNARCIWNRCREVTLRMLAYLEDTGKICAPVDQDDIDEFLEFVDSHMRYAHHEKKKDRVLSLPRQVTTSQFNIEGVADWDTNKKNDFQRLKVLSFEQLSAYVDWCIHHEHMFEVSSAITKDDKIIGIISHTQESKRRVAEIWSERAYAWLKRWSNTTPECDWWEEFSNLREPIKTGALQKIQPEDFEALNGILNYWREYEKQKQHVGWKDVVREIDRVIRKYSN